MNTYPLTIRRSTLEAHDACLEGLADFGALAPSGEFVIASVEEHSRLIWSGRWPEWHAWAVASGIYKPIVIAVGAYGTASAGWGGTASTGSYGTASAGYRGTAVAGIGGSASAGDRGSASAGWGGSASAGDRGSASAGDQGSASAGIGGSISIQWREGTRWRRAVAEIDGITYLPGVRYIVRDGRLVPVEEAK